MKEERFGIRGGRCKSGDGMSRIISGRVAGRSDSPGIDDLEAKDVLEVSHVPSHQRQLMLKRGGRYQARRQPSCPDCGDPACPIRSRGRHRERARSKRRLYPLFQPALQNLCEFGILALHMGNPLANFERGHHADPTRIQRSFPLPFLNARMASFCRPQFRQHIGIEQKHRSVRIYLMAFEWIAGNFKYLLFSYLHRQCFQRAFSHTLFHRRFLLQYLGNPSGKRKPSVHCPMARLMAKRIFDLDRHIHRAARLHRTCNFKTSSTKLLRCSIRPAKMKVFFRRKNHFGGLRTSTSLPTRVRRLISSMSSVLRTIPCGASSAGPSKPRIWTGGLPNWMILLAPR